ncbi:DUF2891 domain-containing protein [Fimbriiglobus ruber]|uniref:DUF2891 domain-containing protein n=1 Tax=Fimbriiglobus ruber TaxID=1908690 RepID=A0A225E520_9BACT|nr:DUF2891 domain-containing protein [Fimbriiglobus ruber]OWK46854.1 hypothetical protein FRUB_00553 [Fimbriiglobus ruber]
MPATHSAEPTPAPKQAGSLTKEQASAFARLALKGIDKEYPHKPGVVWAAAADIKNPKALHPAFHGCYDWHSSVHGHWLLASVLKRFPDMAEAKQIRTILGQHLTAENLKTEAAYFTRADAKSFERPYGWTWLLKLAEELHDWDDADARNWSANLKPLAELIASRYVEFFPKQTYPIRSGVHSNTAFGLSFAHDYARTVGDKKLQAAIENRARAYFGADENAPARWEPDGADFLSPSLCEADLMRRVLPAAEFRVWLSKYLPGAAKGEPASLFAPATVTDRTDPQLVHLDGLNLSRAWCMKGIASVLSVDDPVRTKLLESASKHAEAGLKHVASGDYAGEHWLASFATHMLSVE